MDVHLRQKVLQILYEKRSQQSQTFDREDLASLIGKPWREIHPEVTYWEEKGYVATKSKPIGTRVYHLLSITAQGIDALEKGQLMQKISIFISSPNDVYEERQIALHVIERCNKLRSIANRYFLTPQAYEEIVPAVVGRRPQTIVDRYMMEASKSDIFICILWQRMGTPVIHEVTGERFQSGTEYEFQSAYRTNQERGVPHILLYRGVKPHLSGIDHEQLIRVQAFFKRFEGEHAELKGLYKKYSSNEEFGEILFHDLDTVIAENFS